MMDIEEAKKDRPTCVTCPYWETPREISARYSAAAGSPRTVEYGNCQEGEGKSSTATSWCPKHPGFKAWKLSHWGASGSESENGS
jgi:hypothetical protein